MDKGFTAEGSAADASSFDEGAATRISRAGYDALHAGNGFDEEPEFYEIVAALARGNKAIDIGCGEGHVERFWPDILATDFSKKAVENALSAGAKSAVQADAQNLPFDDDEFYLSLSNGTLEHIADQERAVSEMARISRVQIFVVHAALPFRLDAVRRMLWRLLKWHDQPIENPLTMKQLKGMLKRSGLRPIFDGHWNYVDLRWISRNIPYGILKWPSHHFIVSIKTSVLERRFMGDVIKKRNVSG